MILVVSVCVTEFVIVCVTLYIILYVIVFVTMWISCYMNVNKGKSLIFQKNYTQVSTFLYRYSQVLKSNSYVDKIFKKIGMNRV